MIRSEIGRARTVLLHRAFRLALVSALALSFGAASGAAAEPVSYSPRPAKTYLEPRTLRYEASALADSGGKSWLAVEAELDARFPGTLEELLALLMAWEDSPKVFSRIESVRVREAGPSGSVTEQTSAVRVFGFAFTSRLVFKNQLKRLGKDGAELSFTMLEGDGSALKSQGGWSLREVSLPGGPAVDILYRCSLIVENRFPLQLSIMKAFGKGDFERTVSELGAAFSARRGGSAP